MGAGKVRSVHFEVKFDGNTSALEEWNKKLLDSGKFGDKTAGSITRMEQEMATYAQKIGLTKGQLDALARTSIKDQKISEFANKYGFAAGEVKRLSGEAEQASTKLSKVNSAMKAFAAGAAAAALIHLGGGMLDKATTAEQTQTSFKVLLQSADRAKAVLKDLNTFSIKTPFEPKEVNAAAQSLLGYQVQQKELLPLMQLVGDVAAGTGKPFNELAASVGKAYSTNKVNNEILQQMPVMQGILAKSMGVTSAKVSEMASSGQIDFAKLEKAFKLCTSAGGTFFGAMDEQSLTFNGMMSTVNGNLDEVQKTIGMMILVALKPLLDLLGQFLAWLLESPNAMMVVKGIFLAIVPVIGILAVSAVMSLVAAFQALAVAGTIGLFPLYLIIAGVILLILVIQDIYTCLTGGEGILSDWLKPYIVGFKILIGFFKALPGQIVAFFKSIPRKLQELIADYIIWSLETTDKMVGFFKSLPGRIIAFFKSIPGKLKALIVEYIEWSATINEKIIGFFKSIPGKIVDFFKSIPGKLKSLISDYMEWCSSLNEKIIGFFKSIPDRIIEFFKSIPGKLKNLLKGIIPDWLAKRLGGDTKIQVQAEDSQKIEARAGGGDVTAGNLYQVNEHGKEYFRPNVGGTVIPMGAADSGSSKSMVFAPVINISCASSDPGSIAKAVQDAIYNVFNDAMTTLGLEATT